MNTKLKFAHLADLHLGAWRESKITKLNFITFKKSVEFILNNNFDFVLFVGDIFNNAMPPIELVEQVILELKKLKNNNIPVYIVGGSHDYSNSGKSFLSLLEKVELLINVSNYKSINKKQLELIKTKNENLKLNLCGISGKKKNLDKNIYLNLNKVKLEEDYFNLFLFHCALDDFKPNFMKNLKVELKKEFLPKGFDYYAGGHIHTFMEGKYESKPISYSGCLFPNNFFEMVCEKPGFNICEFNFENKKLSIERKEIKTYKTEYLKLEFNLESPVEARNKIFSKLEMLKIEGKIILLQFSGIIEGKISDMQINKIVAELYDKGAYVVLKNTYKLTNSKMGDFEVILEKDIENIETEIIKLNLKDSKTFEKDFNIINKVLNLNLSKNEEEKISQFEERIIKILDDVVENKVN